MMYQEILHHNRLSTPTRCGGALVCVLVVMLVIALLAAQTMQMLVVLHRRDSQRDVLRQAREVAQWSRTIAASASESNQALESAGAGTSEPAVGTFQVVVEESMVAEVQITGSAMPSAERRIIVRYPIENDSQVTVTWEGKP